MILSNWVVILENKNKEDIFIENNFASFLLILFWDNLRENESPVVYGSVSRTNRTLVIAMGDSDHEYICRLYWME